LLLNLLRHITYLLLNIAALVFLGLAIYWVAIRAFDIGLNYTLETNHYYEENIAQPQYPSYEESITQPQYPYYEED